MRKLSHTHQKPCDACDSGTGRQESSTTNQITVFTDMFSEDVADASRLCFAEWNWCRAAGLSFLLLLVCMTSQHVTGDGGGCGLRQRGGNLTQNNHRNDGGP